MENGLFIRMAETSDAMAVKEIMKIAFEKYIRDSGISTTVEALTETIEQIELDIKNKYVYMAFMDGIPVGSFRITLCNDATALLTRFGVVTGFSNRGIGNELLAFIDILAEKLKINKLMLNTAVSHTKTMNFYLKRGFYVDSAENSRGYERALLIKEY